jgi:hypothetical protein
MNRPNIEEIKARAEKATGGEWYTDGIWLWTGDESDKHPANVLANTVAMDIPDPANGPLCRCDKCKANFRFIVAARTDMPALIEYAEWLESELQKANEDTARIDAWEQEGFKIYKALDMSNKNWIRTNGKRCLTLREAIDAERERGAK